MYGGELRDVPDIALEVVIKSGGIAKLPVYAGLRVREVWFFESGQFHLHGLTDEGYQPLERSTLVPDLDVVLLATYAQRPDQHEAILEFRDLIRQR